MAHAENEIEINRSPADVFIFLADGKNNLKWRQGVVSIELESGNPGEVGSRFKQVLHGPGGRQIPGDYEVTNAIPGKVLEFHVIAGPARPTGSYLLESNGAGTKLKFILDFQPKGLLKLMAPMIQKTMDAEIGQLPKLKEVLEEK